ncbi:MAG: phosphopantetheine-binding protein [bacterium]|nr:phosphopantetheine-binding protein [bacterium]
MARIDSVQLRESVLGVLEKNRSSAFSGEISDATTLGDLGLDSLDIVDTSLELEEELGIELPDDPGKVSGTTTVKELISYIESLM